MSILVLAEHEHGKFKKTAFELLGKAGSLGGPVVALVLGDGPDPSTLGAYGASIVFKVPGNFDDYDTDKVVAAVLAGLKSADPDVVLAPASFLSKDALPRVTARLGTGQAAECTDLRADGGKVVGRRPVFAGKVFCDATPQKRPAIFTVRPNSFPQPDAKGGTAEVVTVAFEAPAPRLKLVERKAPATEVADLTEASRIVSGGRSLKSKESFDAVVRPLAASIGATVGASRAAVDAGYAPHGDQVGQTGKVVNPSLYVALGISGAIQHLAGMRTSKVIVAINTDPGAPIFEHATYGIVADLFEAAPKLQKRFEALD